MNAHAVLFVASSLMCMNRIDELKAGSIKIAYNDLTVCIRYADKFIENSVRLGNMMHHMNGKENVDTVAFETEAFGIS